jgi:putative drug exporter of the RND superfamily
VVPIAKLPRVGQRRSRGSLGSKRSREGRERPWLLRHPRGVLAVAAVLLVALGLIGTGVEGQLDPTTLNVPGTSASKANELLREHFGDSAPFAILLQGPAAAIDRQGPALVEALRREPGVTTLSPWDRGSVARLRPTPRRALILADFHVDIKTAVDETVPRLNEILAREIRPPVRATQSGFATLSGAIQDESIEASERGELIALPFLLIILLLVFRSPIAAAIPLGFGAATVIASRGLLYLATSWFKVDAFALTVCTMMGLALGVDYALLMVSRFREELAAGTEPAEAARRTRHTAGRTTMFAGSTLVLSMAVSLFILPGSLLASLAGTLIVVVLLSVTVATVVGPALLTLVGANLDRWRIGRAAGGRSRLIVFVTAALRRPAPVAALIAAVLLLLAAPALGLKTGPPSPEELAKDSTARRNAELIDHAIGPGWDAPFQVIAVSEEGPITDPKNLAALDHLQHRLASLSGVQAVIGPAQATKPVEPLQDLGNAVLTQEGNIGPVKQLGRLGRSLAVAAGGVGELRAGITEASQGAGLLALGSSHAVDGAQMIAAGLGRATAGSERAIGALERFSKGTERLTEALQKAAIGALQIKAVLLGTLVPDLRLNGLRHSKNVQKALNEEANSNVPRLIGPAASAEGELKAALAQLQAMGVGKTDPAYPATLEAVRKALAAVSGADPLSGQPYAAGYSGLPAELTDLQKRLVEEHHEATETTYWIITTIHYLKQAGRGAQKLTRALERLHRGAGHLADGSDRLAAAAGTLGKGLARLASGATELVGGLGQLAGGAEALEASLAQGVEETAPLQSGLREASVRVLAGKMRIRHQARRVRRATPNLFNSGYFVLSAVDGAPPEVRRAAGETIDLNGGQAAAVLVISRYPFNSRGSRALNATLDGEAKALGEDADLRTGVAGGAAQLNDYGSVTEERIPWVIVAITVATFLVLVVVLRALLLAAVAVALNLLTVAVAFGILTLLFHLPEDWPLGGHSYVEAVGATMIFGVVFGLSIDYAVFLLTRMREHYDEHGDHAAAIRFGLARTAGVITGAAAIMMAVFIAFAGAPIATVSQLGVGLTVAVILDATVVRIVLLPALMLLLGDRVWWLPRPLARVLPKFSV